MKICVECLIEKPLSEFHKQKGCTYGVNSKCKTCRALISAKRYLNLKSHINKINSEYRRKNRDVYLADIKRRSNLESEKIRKHIYAETNREKVRISKRNYKFRNIDMRRADRAKRRAAELNATPIWANKEEILKIYAEAKRLNELTGLTYHVDHIIPLQNEKVCGLHVEFNLRPILAIENYRKNNKLILDDEVLNG